MSMKKFWDNFINYYFAPTLYPINIYQAAYHQDLRKLSTLITQNVDLNMKNKDGNTALHIAAQRGNFKAVKLLLANGADPQQYNTANELATDLVWENILSVGGKLKYSVTLQVFKEYYCQERMSDKAIDSLISYYTKVMKILLYIHDIALGYGCDIQEYIPILDPQYGKIENLGIIMLCGNTLNNFYTPLGQFKNCLSQDNDIINLQRLRDHLIEKFDIIEVHHCIDGVKNTMLIFSQDLDGNVLPLPHLDIVQHITILFGYQFVNEHVYQPKECEDLWDKCIKHQILEVSHSWPIDKFFNSNNTDTKIQLANKILHSNLANVFLNKIFSQSNDQFILHNIIIPLVIQATLDQNHDNIDMLDYKMFVRGIFRTSTLPDLLSNTVLDNTQELSYHYHEEAISGLEQLTIDDNLEQIKDTISSMIGATNFFESSGVSSP